MVGDAAENVLIVIITHTHV